MLNMYCNTRSFSYFFSHWCSGISKVWYILPVAVFTVAFNIPRFLELETCFVPHSDNITLPILCPTELRINPDYSRKMLFQNSNFMRKHILIFGPLYLFTCILTISNNSFKRAKSFHNCVELNSK